MVNSAKYTLTNNSGKDCYYVVRQADKKRRKRRKHFLAPAVDAKLVLAGRKRQFELDSTQTEVEVTILGFSDQKILSNLKGDLEIKEDGTLRVVPVDPAVAALQLQLEKLSKENERLKGIIETASTTSELSARNPQNAKKKEAVKKEAAKAVKPASPKTPTAKTDLESKALDARSAKEENQPTKSKHVVKAPEPVQLQAKEPSSEHDDLVAKWLGSEKRPPTPQRKKEKGRPKKSKQALPPEKTETPTNEKEEPSTDQEHSVGPADSQHGEELIQCVKIGDLTRISKLINEGVYLNFRDKSHHTALMWAAIYDRADAVKLLLDDSTDSRKTLPSGDEAIHLACKWGHYDIIKVLLEKGKVPVDCPGYEGRTPLMYAALSGKHECVKLLLKHGASKTKRNNEGKRPIDFARSYSINRDLI